MSSGRLRRASGAGLRRHVPGFRELVSCERLSGGASQETYRVICATQAASDPLAVLPRRRRRCQCSLPRLPGPARRSVDDAIRPHRRRARAGDATAIFTPEDELGDGFVMEWLDGETLGARIVRSPELAEIRPRLAEQCGAGAGAHPRHRPRGQTGLDRVPRPHPAGGVRRADLAALPGLLDAAADDRLHRALAAGAPAGRRPSTRLVHNDFRNGNLMVSPRRHRRGARLGARPHRRPDARPRLAVHQLVALRRERAAGGRLRRPRGSVPRLRVGLGKTRRPRAGEVLGGLRLVLVGDRLPADGASTTAAAPIAASSARPSAAAPRSARSTA